MTPTMHLRFVERDEIDPENSTNEYIARKQVRKLQQFWETQNGSDVIGDMFIQIYGVWRDIPLVKD